MKKNVFKIFSSILFSCAFVSCNLNVFEGELPDEMDYTPRTIASKYLEKMITIDGFNDSRTAMYGDEFPSFLAELDIEDAEGNKLLFSDMEEKEKEAFFEYWKEQVLNEMTEKISEDSDLAEMLVFENAAIEQALEDTRGSRAIESKDYEMFFEIYEKKLQKILKLKKTDTCARGGAFFTSEKILSDSELVESSMATLKNIYKQGRLLICQDSIFATNANYLGHISMMSENRWNKSFENDALERITVTATPQNLSAQWEGKTDGVQMEPIGYWISQVQGCAQTVGAYDVQSCKWIWNWFKSHFEKKLAPQSDCEKAVNYAKSKIGTPYCLNIFNKWDEKNFYCSSLVWRAWYNASKDYDLSLGGIITFVSPSDIANSMKTVRVTKFNNK